ncbi:recombinase family protein [Agreia bicolorata]|uniref:recombinase family protein n=1 Tax=Agreia bicolorata TaxID=110935 RepID=UPI003CC81025
MRPSARWRAQPVSTSQLAAILRDPYYTGLVRFKGQIFEGNHEALIDSELFARVQDVMSERARRGQRDRVHHHYLKGLLRCERCHKTGRDSRMIYIEAKGNKGAIYNCFLCRARQDGLCDLPYLPADEVESAVAHGVGPVALTHNFSGQLKSDIADALQETQEGEKEVHTRLKKQLEALTIQEDRLYDLAMDTELTNDRLKERIRAVKVEQADLRSKLTQTDDVLERGAKTLMAYIELLSDPETLYRDSPNRVRRLLLEAFFECVRLGEDLTVQATGAPREAVQELRDADQSFRTSHLETAVISAGTQKETPRRRTRGLKSELEPRLANFFAVNSSSKSILVGRVGLEPTTDGL